MPTIEVSMNVMADKQKVFEIIKAMERFPDFMRNVKQIKILERKDDRIVTEWKTDIDGAPIEWVEEDVFDDEEMSCKFKAIEGDYKYEGRWRLNEDGQGKTVVSLLANFDWEVPTFEKFVGHILEKKARNALRSMLNAIKKKVKR